jgi:hypothetical protein
MFVARDKTRNQHHMGMLALKLALVNLLMSDIATARIHFDFHSTQLHSMKESLRDT